MLTSSDRRSLNKYFVLLQCICYICGYTGTQGSQRQYFLENKYKLTEEEIGTYLFNYRIACWLGLWLVVPFLTNVFKLSDSIIAVIAVVTASTGINYLFLLNDFSSSSGYFLPVFTDTQEWARSGSFVLNWFSFGGFLGLLNPVYMVVNR